MESRGVCVSGHEAEMETKCALDLSSGQIPAMPNHFISPVDHFKRSHFREDSAREPPLSLP